MMVKQPPERQLIAVGQQQVMAAATSSSTARFPDNWPEKAIVVVGISQVTNLYYR
jgi:hypothetical protein